MADREGEEAVAAAGEDHGPSGAGEEEDTGAQIAPIVRLEEVAINTGEENEEAVLDMKAKLYRFDQAWKERGTGQIKILKDKETKKTRLLMRQNRTLKICANHYLSPGMTLQEHAGNDKTWVWPAMDYSDGEMKKELLCVRFGNAENAQKFRDLFLEATEEQGEKKPETKDVSQVTETLEKLSVVTDPTKKPDADEKDPKPKPAEEAEVKAAEADVDGKKD